MATKRAIVLAANRETYSIDQLVSRGTALTVADLMDMLGDMDGDDLVIISHDSGYTYGGLEYVEEVEENEDGEWETIE